MSGPKKPCIYWLGKRAVSYSKCHPSVSGVSGGSVCVCVCVAAGPHTIRVATAEESPLRVCERMSLCLHFSALRRTRFQ